MSIGRFRVYPQRGSGSPKPRVDSLPHRLSRPGVVQWWYRGAAPPAALPLTNFWPIQPTTGQSRQRQKMSTPQTLQVSCVQLHWAQPLERNLDRTLHFIRRAAEEGSRVVLFPEANLT